MANCLTDAQGQEIGLTAERAEAAARAALLRDPDSVDARLQLALALGVIGRLASDAEAVRAGYAREGRRLIDEAIARDPENPLAHALLGAWHLEVIRRGGRAGAVFYGARTDRGLAAFERAVGLAGADSAILLLYETSVLELDANKYAALARDLLGRAAHAPASDAFARDMRAEARRLGAVLSTQGARAAADMASDRLG